MEAGPTGPLLVAGSCGGRAIKSQGRHGDWAGLAEAARPSVVLNEQVALE